METYHGCTMINCIIVFLYILFRDGEVRFEDLSHDSKQAIRHFPSLAEWVKSVIGRRKWEQHHPDRLIYQLLRELLIIDPHSRVRARDALKLPFFSD